MGLFLVQTASARIDSLRHSVSEVVVTGTRAATDTRHLPLTVSVVGRERLNAAFRPSVLPTLSEQVPGLFVTSRGVLGYGVSTGAAGTIKVRGIGGGANMLVLVDGQPQYAGLMGHPIADAYQSMLAERVEMVRGPGSVIYGSNAMGGVMNIVTRRPQEGVQTDIRLGGGSYGTLTAEASNTVRQGKLSSVVGLSALHTDGHRPDMAFDQYTGFAKLGYDLSQRWSLMGDVSLTRFNASNPGTTSSPLIDNDSEITRGLASLNLTNDYGHTQGALRLFYNWGHHHIDDGYSQGGTPQANYYLHDDRMGGLSLYQAVRLWSGNHTTVGFDWFIFGGHAWNESKADASRSELADRHEHQLAGYLDFRQDLARWLTVDAGVRVDNHSQSGTEWVPQLGLTVRPDALSTVKATVGKSFRNPTIRELYMFRPANADLQPERMMNYELAYSRRMMDERLRVGFNVFYLKAENLISTTMVDGRPRNVNTGETENSGFEAEASFLPDSHWTLNANYSYLHTSAPITAAPRHKVYLGADYRLGRLGLGTGFQYFANLRTSESGPANGHAALLRLTAKYQIAKWLGAYLTGENLLAQRYEVNAGFPMPRATVMGGVNLAF